MIDSSHELWHAVVICVFRFEGEFLISASERRNQATAVTAHSPVRPHSAQGCTTVFDEPQPHIPDAGVILRSPIDGAKKIIVHEWRPNRQLTLLGRKDAVVIPGRLAKSRK